jgi:hypothetical protein
MHGLEVLIGLHPRAEGAQNSPYEDLQIEPKKLAIALSALISSSLKL